MPQIGVIGASQCGEKIEKIAFEVGRLIAKENWILITGGKGGVMEAVSRGAKEEGGLVVGILPEDSSINANPWLCVTIPTGMQEARNQIIVLSSDALIAISGEYGTLSEIGFALKRKKCVIGINTWRIKGVKKAKSPKEAIAMLKSILK